MALQSQPNYQQGLDILSKLAGVKLVDNSDHIARLNMMMANAATLQERAQMAEIARQTGENIDPYNIRPDQQGQPLPPVSQGGKTMTYEQQQELTRQHNLMIEQQRQAAMARRRALLEQSAKASKSQIVPSGYVTPQAPARSAIDIIKAPEWGE